MILKTEDFKNFAEANSIELSEIELPRKGDEEVSIQEIKSNLLIFSDVFIVFFNKFRKDFSNYKEAKAFIQEIEKIALELINLKSYKYREIQFGIGAVTKRITVYVQSKYFIMQDFFDLCEEIYLK